MDDGHLPHRLLDVDTALRQRHSVRRFQSRPVDRAILSQAFDVARWAPSNCNSQPWLVKVVSAAGAERLKAALLADVAAGRMSADFAFDTKAFTGVYQERMAKQNETLNRARGSTTTPEGRRQVMESNVTFFGAPHCAFFFLPAWGNERQAADLGMFAQSAALALTSRGVATCPQTSLGFFAPTIRRELGVGPDHKFLFGMSIGYAEPGHQAVDQGRAPLEDLVAFIDE